VNVQSGENDTRLINDINAGDVARRVVVEGLETPSDGPIRSGSQRKDPFVRQRSQLSPGALIKEKGAPDGQQLQQQAGFFVLWRWSEVR
jgi:hypothetical protein